MPLTGESVYYYFNKAENETASQCTQHYHNTLEIYYLKEGRCNYFIDNRSYELVAGDLVLIPEGVIHRTNYPQGETHTRYLINCQSSYVPRGVLPLIPSMVYLYRNKSLSEEVERIFLCIEEEYGHEERFKEESLRSLTALLFILLAREAKECREFSTGSPFIEQTVKYIQKNYMNDITLSQMASAHSVSAEHLSRTFKKETGFGFSEYITLVRLQKAEYMLRNEPGKSICEVAYACGFNDSNYFSDKFKKAYGVPPTKIKGSG